LHRRRSCVGGGRGARRGGTSSLLPIPDRSAPTIADLIREYRALRLIHLRSRRSVELALDRMEEAWGGRAVEDITRHDLDTFMARLSQTPTRWGKPRAPGTVNRDMIAIKSVLSKGVEWGYCKDNPGTRFQLLRQPPAPERYLTYEELCCLEGACALWLCPLVRLAWTTGMRLGELLVLRWADVDLRALMIYVRHDKAGRSRRVPILDRALKGFQMIPRRIGSPWVFPVPDGDGHRTYTYGPFRSAAQRAGLEVDGAEKVTFHTLRHTCFSLLAMEGVEEATRARIAGHTTTRMQARYTHLSEAHLRRALGVLDRVGEEAPLTRGQTDVILPV